MTLYDLFKEAVEMHGEVHAVVADHDAELEVRKGQATFHDDAEVVEVEDGDTVHYVDVADVSRFYEPTDVLHE